MPALTSGARRVPDDILCRQQSPKLLLPTAIWKTLPSTLGSTILTLPTVFCLLPKKRFFYWRHNRCLAKSIRTPSIPSYGFGLLVGDSATMWSSIDQPPRRGNYSRLARGSEFIECVGVVADALIVLIYP